MTIMLVGKYSEDLVIIRDSIVKICENWRMLELFLPTLEVCQELCKTFSSLSSTIFSIGVRTEKKQREKERTKRELHHRSILMFEKATCAKLHHPSPLARKSHQYEKL